MLSSVYRLIGGGFRLVAGHCVRLLRLVRCSARDVLVVAPASPGSIGDEAMLHALCSALYRKELRPVVGVASEGDSYKTIGVHDTYPLYRYHSLGSISDRLRLVLSLTRFRAVYLIGADCMDGFYSEYDSLRRLQIAGLASVSGASAVITGFSFNAQPTPQIVAEMAGQPEGVTLYARDKESLNRLHFHGITRARLVADLAFLLEAGITEAHTQAAVDWSRERRCSGRTVIGVNISFIHTLSSDVYSPQRIVDCSTQLIEAVAAKFPLTSFILIPHDVRGEHSDAALLQRVYERVSAYDVFMYPPPLHACDIKALAAHLDMGLTGRMHFAIACLGSGVPVFCLEYQDKFSGLLGFFGLESEALPAATAFKSEVLAEKCMNMLERLPEVAAQVTLHLDEVKQLSRRNMEGLR
ncbi:polysaccharide pyruvyl transferase family protein [Oleidesulfovibrio sp.]|uniref:polysaccharide pyruvyl transferase family protein n=1 Tax=Oleidesulfovibrio sp. TaxID=2909707 RepID=UPI003A858480